MTIEEKLTKLLIDHGMSQSGAGEVMAAVKAHDDTDNQDGDASKGGPMTGRWNDHIEGYPPQFLPVLWFGVKVQALAWIDKNLPQAFYRSMFVD